MVNRRVIDRVKDAEGTQAAYNTRITTLENAAGGQPPPPPPSPPSPPATPNFITYSYSDENFNNPGRGREESYEGSPGDLGGLEGYEYTTFRRYWYIPAVEGPQAQWVLDGVDDDLDYMISQGKLANAKFAYGGPGDYQPSLSSVNTQIDQLMPIINAKSYALKQIEMGFMGPWGEYHGINAGGWSDPPGYANGNHVQAKAMFERIANLTPNNNLSIGVRYVAILEYMFNNGLSGANQNRAAFYNDFFIAVGNEYAANGLQAAHEGGTFPDAWTDGYDWASRDWIANFGLTHNCRAESDTNGQNSTDWANRDGNALYHGFQRQHIDNLREWGLIDLCLIPSGIWDRVQRDMGYRLFLEEGRFPTAGVQGQTLTFDLKIRNRGYAPPRRAHVAKIKFGNTANASAPAWVTASMFNVNLDSNGLPTTTGSATTPRDWVGFVSSAQEETSRWVRFTCTIPAGLAAATYPISLAFVDPATQLQGDIRYNIRLANNGTWNAGQGRNALLANIPIT